MEQGEVPPLSAGKDARAAVRPGVLRKNTLGAGGIVFMVISAAALLTIVAGIAPLAIPIGGVGAPLAYVIAGLVLGIFAVAFMAMTRYVKVLGGFYTYIAHALGKEIGLGSSLIALVACNALQIGLYGLLGAQAHDLVKKELGINVPWWLIAIIGVLAVFIVAHRGIDIGARVLDVLPVAESLILAIFAVAVVFFVRHGDLARKWFVIPCAVVAGAAMLTHAHRGLLVDQPADSRRSSREHHCFGCGAGHVPDRGRARAHVEAHTPANLCRNRRSI